MHTIRPLNLELDTEIVDFVCTEFVSGSVLHRTLGVKLEDYTDYMTESIVSVIQEGFSYLAIDSADESISGCILAGDLAISLANMKPVPNALKPMKAILNDLENCYRDMRAVSEGNALLVDVAVVSRNAMGQGIYSQLRQAVHTVALQRGYSSVIGELTSAITQHLCVEKLGHEILCEIEYESFEFEGAYPFATIKQPPSIQLVEGRLI